MHIPKLLQNTRKTAPTKHQNASEKWSTIDQKWVPELPRRPLGPEACFWICFWCFLESKWTPKWSQKRSNKYVLCACFSDTIVLRFLSDKWSLLVYLWSSFWSISELLKIRKMMLPCKREHHFRDPGSPKSIQRSIKKRLQKKIRKSRRFLFSLASFWLHFGSTKRGKIVPKTMWILSVFWSCPGGGHSSGIWLGT